MKLLIGHSGLWELKLEDEILFQMQRGVRLWGRVDFKRGNDVLRLVSRTERS